MTTATAARAAEAATTSTAEPLARDGRPGDGAAALRVSELFERHGATVLGLCRVLLRNEHEAEDARQQTFLAAYRSLLNGGEPRYPAAWLATIARNECWSIARRRMREPLGDAEPEGSLPDPVVAAAERADLRELWRAIGSLPRQQRKAILLREFSGLSYDELAIALGVSEPAVESLLFRARRELRTRLRPVYGSFVIAPLNAVRDALAPVAMKLGAGATAVVVAGGTVAAVETHTLRREIAVQPADASVLPDRARHVSTAPVPRAVPPVRAGTSVPHHPAPVQVRLSPSAIHTPAPVPGGSAAAPAGGTATPPVVAPPAPAPAAAPAAAPPEPDPAAGGDDPPGDDASPATGTDGGSEGTTSASDDGGTSSGEGSGAVDDNSGPGGGGDDSGGSSGPSAGGDSSGPGGGDDGGTSGSSGSGGGGDDSVSGGSGSGGSGSGGSDGGGDGEPES